MNRSAFGAMLMITTGATLFLIAFAHHERAWSFIGLACAAIGFSRLHKAGS